MSGEDERSSDSIHAVGVLVRSERFRPVFAWVLGVLLTGLGGVGGWIVHLVTDRSELRQVGLDISQMKADIAVIRSDNTLRNELLRDSSRSPGKVVQLERDQEVVWRELIKCYAAAYATEPERTRRAKRAAALEFKDSYDGRVNGGSNPISAYTEVTQKVSVP